MNDCTGGLCHDIAPSNIEDVYICIRCRRYFKLVEYV